MTNILPPRPTDSDEVITHHSTSVETIPCDDSGECTTIHTARHCEKRGSPVPCHPPHPHTSSNGPQPPLPPQSAGTSSRPAVGPKPAKPSSSHKAHPPIPPIPAGSTTYPAEGPKPPSETKAEPLEGSKQTQGPQTHGDGRLPPQITGSTKGGDQGTLPSSRTQAQSPPEGSHPTQGAHTQNGGTQDHQPPPHGTGPAEGGGQVTSYQSGSHGGQRTQASEASQQPGETGTQGVVEPANSGSIKRFSILTPILAVIANIFL